MKSQAFLARAARPLGLATTALLFCLSLSGCLVIGGRSRGGGFFFLPGGLVGLVLLLLLISAIRRRN